MARGSQAKEAFMAVLLENFPNGGMSPDNKSFRIPYEENGERVELKISMVAAKDSVLSTEPIKLEGGAAPVKRKNKKDEVDEYNSAPAWEAREVGQSEQTTSTDSTLIEPSQEELDNIDKMMAALGI